LTSTLAEESKVLELPKIGVPMYEEEELWDEGADLNGVLHAEQMCSELLEIDEDEERLELIEGNRS